MEQNIVVCKGIKLYQVLIRLKMAADKRAVYDIMMQELTGV